MRILYLDLDTLRADHLGCYGYHRETSPNIDRVAAEGVRFDNYYCSDAPCLPSRTALYSGRFGIHTGVVGHGGTNADIRPEGAPRGFKDTLVFDSLPGFLRSQGFKTVSISPFGERHSAWHFYAGFSEMHNTGKSGGESAEEVTPTVLKWIEGNAQEDNWFLQVNYWDPHGAYRAPMEFGNPFEDEPLPAWLTPEVFAEHLKAIGPMCAQEKSFLFGRRPNLYPRQPKKLEDMNDLRGFIDGYDCGIRYMDTHIGMLFDALDRGGVLDDLVIMISTDHGENQGELGIYEEHGTPDQITSRIPMIIRWPGRSAGHVDTGLHYNLDLPPTMAELLGAEPMPRWDGQSYAPALRGEPCGRDYLVLSQCAHVCMRSVRFGPWLYLRSYHDGYYNFPDEMLFNVEQDPHEEHDLATAHPELCREAVYYLNEWHDQMMRSMPYDVDPLWTVMKEDGPYHAKEFMSRIIAPQAYDILAVGGELPYQRGSFRAYVDYLEKTGRGHAVEELVRKHPEFAG